MDICNENVTTINALMCNKSLSFYKCQRLKLYNYLISFCRMLPLLKFITQPHLFLFLQIIPPKMEAKVQFITA